MGRNPPKKKKKKRKKSLSQKIARIAFKIGFSLHYFLFFLGFSVACSPEKFSFQLFEKKENLAAKRPKKKNKQTNKPKTTKESRSTCSKKEKLHFALAFFLKTKQNKTKKCAFRIAFFHVSSEKNFFFIWPYFL